MMSSARTLPEISSIPPGQEQAFSSWLKRNNVRDLDAPGAFYDYRGAFLAGINRSSNGHWPDTFKQHGHPTFSVESQYALPNDPQAGRWNGERYMPPMTAIPSANTAPVRDRTYWTSVIHNAAKVGPESPRYGEARQVAQIALENLGNLMERKNIAETPKPDIPTARLGTAMNAFQGVTLGFGDEALGGLAGLGTLLTGGGLQAAANRGQQTREGFLEQRANFFHQDPALAIGGDLAGTAYNPLNKVLGPLTQGLKPVAKAAVYGATIGGARGLGEGEGAAGRAGSAAIGAAIGLISGSVLGKAIKVVGPTLGKLVDNARRILGPRAAPAEVENAVEASIRSRLAKRNVSPEDVERAVQSWRQTGELSVRRLAETHPPSIPAPPPPTVRPGETIQPTHNLEKATFLRRGGTVRQDMSPISGNRSMSFDPGKGQTLPWYPRGGAIEQSVAPLPATSVPTQTQLGQNQMGVFLDYLKQATTPQDALARLGTLRDLGIPTPGDPAQVLSLLFGAQR